MSKPSNKAPPKLLLSLLGILNLSAEGIIGVLAAVVIVTMVIFGARFIY